MNRLVHILDLATQAYRDEEIDTYGLPLLQVLLRIAEFAPASPKAHLRALLLPLAKDREKALGESHSLPSRLLKLSTTPTAPRLQELISALFFELSDKDAGLFVRNVGYGYAAGFLFSKGTAPPSTMSEVWSAGDNHHRREESQTEGRGPKVEQRHRALTSIPSRARDWIWSQSSICQR